MVGLMIKDFLLGKRYLKTLLLLAVLYGGLAFFSEQNSMLGALVVVISMMFCMAAFAYDDAAKWDAFAISMPVGREKMVQARYAVGYLCTLVGSVLCSAAVVVFSLFRSLPVSEGLAVTLGCAVAGVIVISVYMPLVYKFGIEKSRFVLVGLLALVGGGGFLLAKWKPVLPSISGPVLLVSGLLIVAVVAVSSYFISVGLYKKKEF